MSAKKAKEKKRSGAGRVILRVLGGILAALLLFLLVMFVIPLTETGDRTAVEGSTDWMAKLDDDLTLDAITIPGTHDSGTRYVQLGFFSKCQAMSIRQQLEAGYRYLDIRLAVDGDGLKLMHGFTDCKTGFGPQSEVLALDAVLEQCYGFLAAHPTETVLFAVKQEHGEMSVAEFQTLLDRYIQKAPNGWLLTDGIPSLGQARGKLILLRRYPDEAGLGSRAGIPFLWPDQPGTDDISLNTAASDNGGYTLWVQDRYEYDSVDKWNAFRAGMDNEAGVKDISLNFLSTKGSQTYGHPYRYARVLNTRLLGTALPAGSFYGWIVVDFGSGNGDTPQTTTTTTIITTTTTTSSEQVGTGVLGDADCNGKNSKYGDGKSFKVSNVPSGVVYEGVIENPVEGAAVTLWYAVDAEGYPVREETAALAAATALYYKYI